MKQIVKERKPFHWSVVGLTYTECRLRGDSYLIKYPDRLGLGRGVQSWFLCILDLPYRQWGELMPAFWRAMEEMML